MNLGMVLDMPATAWPERTAITFRGQERKEFSFGELQDMANQWADYLRETGITRVVAVGENHPGMIALIFGCGLAGADFASLNYRFKAREMEHCIRTIGAEAVFTWNVRTGAVQQAVEAIDPSPVVIDVTDRDLPPTERPRIGGARPSESPNIYIFTSGTTKLPKAVILGPESLSQYLFGSYEPLSASEDEATVVASPLYHVAGFMNTLSAVFMSRRIVLLPTFEPEEWLKAVQEEKVTHAFLVPTMLSRVVSTVREHPELYPTTLKNLSYGGAPSTPQQIRAAIETFPDVDLVGAFGLTETSSTVAILGPDDHRKILTGSEVEQARINSVGKPIPAVEIIVADPVTNEPVGPGEKGEVLVRGPQVSGRYLGAPDRIDDQGWFHTADLGYFDEEGYLFLAGRADDMIQRGAENVSPREVELAFEEHPKIEEVAAVGVPHPDWGQVVALAVVPKKDQTVTEEELRAWARERLSSAKRPEYYVFMDELPRTATGKILAKDIRAMLAESPEFKNLAGSERA